MRIGIDARFYGTTGKGLGRYTQKLIEYLERFDQENEYVILLRKENWDQYTPHNNNFHKVLADYQWYTLQEQIQFPRLLSQQKLDLVHFPHFNVPVFFKGKFIVTIHDLILTHYPTIRASTLSPILYMFKHRAYKYVITKAVKKAQKILTVSEFTKNDIIKHFHLTDPSRVAVTYEGVDIPNDIISNDEKDNLLKRFTITKPYVLYVGNVYPHKNLEKFIKAFKDIITRDKDLLFVLVGKEDYFFKRLRAQVERTDLSKNIVFTGFVTDSELFTLYANARLFVFPSLYEGFGLPPLEAMSAGTPVVASRATSIPEVCGDAAVYFDPNNIYDMIQSVERVLTDEALRQNLIQNGKKRIQDFHWDTMARETLDVYQTI
ncbi:glycosyltransferase family 4 protein [Patescibacteria group bacterium]